MSLLCSNNTWSKIISCVLEYCHRPQTWFELVQHDLQSRKSKWEKTSHFWGKHGCKWKTYFKLDTFTDTCACTCTPKTRLNYNNCQLLLLNTYWLGSLHSSWCLTFLAGLSVLLSHWKQQNLHFHPSTEKLMQFLGTESHMSRQVDIKADESPTQADESPTLSYPRRHSPSLSHR